MHSAVRTYYEKLLETLIPELKKRNIEAIYCRTREEAHRIVMDMIPEGSSVNTGGSITLKECGLLDAINNGPYDVCRKWIRGENDEVKRFDLRRKASTADFCVGSLNAIALTGEIVNIDGGGSRVGGYVYGARKVILVTGVNKIVLTLEEALRRARYFAAPVNAIDGEKDAVCLRDGICHEDECYGPMRQCGKTLIIEREARRGRMTVVFVGEELGF